MNAMKLELAAMSVVRPLLLELEYRRVTSTTPTLFAKNSEKNDFSTPWTGILPGGGSAKWQEGGGRTDYSRVSPEMYDNDWE
jgi:hypothetical protein